MQRQLQRMTAISLLLILTIASADARLYRQARPVKKWTPPAVSDLLPRYPGSGLESEMILEQGYLLPAVSKFASEALGLRLAAAKSSGTLKDKQSATALNALAEAIKGVNAIYFSQSILAKPAETQKVMAYYGASKAATSMKRVFYFKSFKGEVTSVWSAWGGKDLLYVRLVPVVETGVTQRIYASRIQGAVNFTKLLQIPLVRQMIESSCL